MVLDGTDTKNEHVGFVSDGRAGGTEAAGLGCRMGVAIAMRGGGLSGWGNGVDCGANEVVWLEAAKVWAVRLVVVAALVVE